ncbi:MAG: VOC family protein [Candidatus Latescibacteria bacterium]|nr:VOC family protein [Candidatus Latescibacterota bacterium]
MEKIQVQGVHHITLVGASRQVSIDFWEGVLGMPFVFEQPNLDNPDESHLYFEPGDGRLITVFTNESRPVDAGSNCEDIGHVHHLAFAVSRATFTQVARRLEQRGVPHTGEIDRGFMDSIYFRDPLGQRIELACYKFVPPPGVLHSQVLIQAHRLRVEEGSYNIQESHVDAAIERLVGRTQETLSEDRAAKRAYVEPVEEP